MAIVARYIFESDGADFTIVVGEVTLDGANPTSVATGLSTIEAASVENKGTDTPGVDPFVFTVNWAATGGQLDIYAWKPGATTDVTLEASGDSAEVVSYFVIGRT